MALASRLFLCLLASAFPLSCVTAKPAGGVAKYTDISLNPISKESAEKSNFIPHADVAGVCKEIGLYDHSTVQIEGYHQATSTSDEDDVVKVPFQIRVKLFKAKCANTVGDELQEKNCAVDLRNSRAALLGLDLMAEHISPMMFADNEKHKFLPLDGAKTTYYSPAPPSSGDKPAASPSITTTTQASNKTTSTPPPEPLVPPSQGPPVSNTQKRSVVSRDNNMKPQNDTVKPKNPNVFHVQNGSAMYIVQILIVHNLTLQTPEGSGTLNVSLTLKMRNPHGYLSAVDYPALVFYGVMTAVYTIYAFAWIVMMACAYKDLVRLQFWVLSVILLGFLEKMLFVSEYGSVNTGNDPSGLIMIAELVSAVKRALSRMLLIIVAMGFGTVKPRLGDSLGKVVAIGVVYTILAVMDGIIRARNETFVSHDAASTVTLALLLIFDTFVMYWIFTAIVDTRRTLRLRKNYVKLSMYNHFAYTLIFAIVASLGFVVWALVTLNFPAGNCLTDWREVWLRECFWHVLFGFILLIVMIIWRPSANRNRFAYSLVNDEEDIEDELEQGPNKNFDTVKMRQMTKSESEAPPAMSSQAEDDLRWVEENLPTTAMDRALPLILDSDEEVMTTKFEISKMD